jgi:hypothetical protein
MEPTNEKDGVSLKVQVNVMWFASWDATDFHKQKNSKQVFINTTITWINGT